MCIKLTYLFTSDATPAGTFLICTTCERRQAAESRVCIIAMVQLAAEIVE